MMMHNASIHTGFTRGNGGGCGISRQGKEATIAMLGPNDFLGEGCIASNQPVRMATATTTTACSVLEIEKKEMLRTLHKEHKFSDIFVAYLVQRHNLTQADLVDQLFNSSEKRLARSLLLLARLGKKDRPEEIIPDISQNTLAEMIGTTRSRVNFFMNKFRKLGFIDYNDRLRVHSSLLSVVLHDQLKVSLSNRKSSLTTRWPRLWEPSFTDVQY
jgi:CRP/FNR family transcriptional regulator, cyclic AMP receptor protein